MAVYSPYLSGTADERQYLVMYDREQWFRVFMGQDEVARLITPDSSVAVPHAGGHFGRAGLQAEPGWRAGLAGSCSSGFCSVEWAEDLPMTRTDPLFEVGATVQRTNQPEAVGVVRDRRWDEASEAWNYSVQFGAQLKGVPEEGLRLFTLVRGPWDALVSGEFSSESHFRFVLTYHRLRRPPARIAHSFTSSRTLFFPHQFKPLLKFLDHPGKRILIADDVGLGKTIEAGYILRELEAHQPVERVLVLVPSRLTRKWKVELRDRFEEHFEVVPGKQLIELAERLRRGSELEPFRWIVSYESARREEVRLALEDTQPTIDVLIADEVHRMRNASTLQHRLGLILTRCADSNIFLSATPVQNGLDDLWHLLRLLSPEEFQDLSLFGSQMEANRHVVAAQRALAQLPPACDEADRHLESFLGSPAGGRLQATALVRAIQAGLVSPQPSRRDVVELQGQIGRLSVVGDIISRTRKAEALPNKAVRDAKWQSVHLTPRERATYDSVETLCLASGISRGSWGSEMALMTAYRVTASCIPAAMGYFREKLADATSLGLALDRQVEESNQESEATEPGASQKVDSSSRSRRSETGYVRPSICGQTLPARIASSRASRSSSMGSGPKTN